MVLGVMVGAVKEIAGGKKEKKDQRIKELKNSIFGVWEGVDKNIIFISNDDETQMRVMVNAMRNINRLEEVADIVGGLSDQIDIYKLASSRTSKVLNKEKIKNEAQQKIKQYIQKLNDYFSISLIFRGE